MRATTSLPDPVGPRMSTEISDLAAVLIHSKTTSIFSSRPIISRKRWTEGAWSSVLMAARRSRNVSNRRAMLSLCGRCAAYFGTWPGILRTTPNSISSFRQFWTSSRMRPKVAMRLSASNASSGRALRNRNSPARRGDCTRFRNRVSSSPDRTGAGLCEALFGASTGYLLMYRPTAANPTAPAGGGSR